MVWVTAGVNLHRRHGGGGGGTADPRILTYPLCTRSLFFVGVQSGRVTE